MKRKIPMLLLLIVLTGVAWLAWWWFTTPTTEKVLFSAVAIFALYLVFSLGLKELGARYFSSAKTRYAFRKATSLFLIVAILLVLLWIWIPNPRALVVAYGVVAAGLAFALQDVVKNLAGTVTIFFSGLYQVGNRIELSGVRGDVIDIGLFNTSLLEIREWINADQATGRITTLPNGAVLNSPVQNYSKHHSYLWDELLVVVTGESDWHEAMRLMTEIGRTRTTEFVEAADKSLTRLERYYYVEGHVLEPNVYIKPHTNGYEIALRYVVNAWKRRSTHSRIWEDIIQTFHEHPHIHIAPTTIAVTKDPDEAGE